MLRELAARLFQDTYRIDSAHRAEQLLQRMATQREPLSVLAGPELESFASMLLHVDRGAGALVVDELGSAHAQALLDAASPFHVLGRVDGVYLGFASHKLAAIEWEGYGALRIAYPDAIYMLQRRGFFRVLVSASDVGEVELQRRGARPLFGQCHDISVSGMRVQFAPPTDYVLSEGEYLPQVNFRLGQFALSTEAEIRFVSAARGSRARPQPRTLGLHFINIKPAFEQRLQSYVQRRDRELLGRS